MRLLSTIVYQVIVKMKMIKLLWVFANMRQSSITHNLSLNVCQTVFLAVELFPDSSDWRKPNTVT